MSQGFAPKSPYPQPRPEYRPRQLLHGLDEEPDYLSGTHIRVWFTYLPTSYPVHRHNCVEIIEGVHSTYTCSTCGRTHTITPGDILIIPPNTLHDLTPGPECNGWIYLFDVEWARSIPSCAEVFRWLTQPILISQKERPVTFMNIAGELSQMRNDYFSENNAREILFNAGVLRLMEMLLTAEQESLRSEGQLDKRHVHGSLFSQVIDYIEENFSRDLRLDEMARHFNLSDAYFSRLFTQYVHESFSDYLAHRRLKEAESLLADASLSITDVALRCGYSSPSAFSRAFLAQRSCTPSQFRRVYVRFMRRSDADVG